MVDKIWVLLTAAFIAASAINASNTAGDEYSGTWRLNVPKSKYSPGPSPKEMTETIELDEYHMKVNANGTAADGQPIHIEFHAKFDGKEYPMIGVRWADTVSVKWTGRHEPQIIQRKHGQVTMIITCKVSADGKTRTCILRGKSEGRDVNDIVVFDRQ